MALIDRLLPRLQRHPKRAVFAEGADPRILQAARLFAARKLGVPILLGNRTEIKDRAARLDLRLDGIRLLNPERCGGFENMLARLRAIPRFADKSTDELKVVLRDNNYFAAMMLRTGAADVFISGATSVSSSGLRALFHVIPLQAHVKTASSMLIFDQEESRLGSQGALFLADCGVIPEPDAEQLAGIAVATGGISQQLTGEPPRVAFLSYATRNSPAKHPSIAKIRDAVRLALEKARLCNLPAAIDGELQVDAALDAVTAQQKGVADSPVAGRANVLIFPDLNCGNIASKMIQIVTGARSYGQIITGLSKPCAEISRGAHAHDIFGAAVIVCGQAVDTRLLHGAAVSETSAPF